MAEGTPNHTSGNAGSASSLRTSGGVELTEELIERLAQQAERGYDPAKLRKVFLAASVAITVDKELLMVRRRRDNRFLGGYWDLLGGKREKDESLRQTARRELLEEGGIDLPQWKLDEAKMVHSFRYPYGGGVVYHQTFWVPMARRFVPRLTEHDMCRWVPLGGALPVPLTDEMTGTVKAVFAELAVRNEPGPGFFE